MGRPCWTTIIGNLYLLCHWSFHAHLTSFAVFILFPSPCHPCFPRVSMLLLKPKLDYVVPMLKLLWSVASHHFQNKTQTLTKATWEAWVIGPQSALLNSPPPPNPALTVLGLCLQWITWGGFFKPPPRHLTQHAAAAKSLQSCPTLCDPIDSIAMGNFKDSQVIQSSLIAQLVKNPPAMQETPVSFLGREDPMEKGLATHSRIQETYPEQRKV